MAWSIPYVWTVGEIITAAKLQTYVSDNLTYLKALDNITGGWIAVSGAWTYASATTITVTAGAASLYNKGDKIRLKQGAGYKYYYIVTVADTLLTVTGGSDYTVANAAITDMYYSKVANPLDFPHYFNYTSTVSGNGGSIGTYAEGSVVSVFSIVEKNCHVQVTKQITNKGSWSGSVSVNAPVAMSSVYGGTSKSLGFGLFLPNASIGNRAFPLIRSDVTQFIFTKQINGTDLQWSDVTATDWININMSYIIA